LTEGNTNRSQSDGKEIIGKASSPDPVDMEELYDNICSLVAPPEDPWRDSANDLGELRDIRLRRTSVGSSASESELLDVEIPMIEATVRRPDGTEAEHLVFHLRRVADGSVCLSHWDVGEFVVPEQVLLEALAGRCDRLSVITTRLSGASARTSRTDQTPCDKKGLQQLGHIDTPKSGFPLVSRLSDSSGHSSEVCSGALQSGLLAKDQSSRVDIEAVYDELGS